MSDPKPVLLVYAWDGTSPPLEAVKRDAAPDFDLLLFDYSGNAAPPEGMTVLSVRTECKGEIYHEVDLWLAKASTAYEYVGLLDDDIETSWSDINRLLEIARAHGLDSFSASLSADSYQSHAQFLTRAGGSVRPVDWVEVMMPFYRTVLFRAGGRYYADSISSYGLDEYVMPTLQKLTDYGRVAVIDAVVAQHRRPITSDSKVFTNGLTAEQERWIQRRRAMAHVAAERPDLLGTRWHLQTFWPDSPRRFWPPRQLARWLWLRALRYRLSWRQAQGR